MTDCGGDPSQRSPSSEPQEWLRRFHRVGWVSLVPCHIPGWSANCRDMLLQLVQICLNLCPLKAGVQDSPPKHPDPLSPLPAKVRHLRQPPSGGRCGDLRQRPFPQHQVFVQVGLHRRLITGGNNSLTGGSTVRPTTDVDSGQLRTERTVPTASHFSGTKTNRIMCPANVPCEIGVFEGGRRS